MLIITADQEDFEQGVYSSVDITTVLQLIKPVHLEFRTYPVVLSKLVVSKDDYLLKGEDARLRWRQELGKKLALGAQNLKCEIYLEILDDLTITIKVTDPNKHFLNFTQNLRPNFAEYTAVLIPHIGSQFQGIKLKDIMVQDWDVRFPRQLDFRITIGDSSEIMQPDVKTHDLPPARRMSSSRSGILSLFKR